MDEERMFASAHLVTPEGAVYSGGYAVAPLLRLLPGGARLALLAATLTGPSRVGYNWVAHNRQLLGRALSDKAKARATARIDRHT
jgi:predicted DCC family thiol-disulfide oxidoreductase YuxK